MTACQEQPRTAPDDGYSIASCSVYSSESPQIRPLRPHAIPRKTMSAGQILYTRRPSDPVAGVLRPRASTLSKELAKSTTRLKDIEMNLQSTPKAEPGNKTHVRQADSTSPTILSSPQSNTTAPYSFRSDPLGDLPHIQKDSQQTSLDDFPSPPRKNYVPHGPHSTKLPRENYQKAGCTTGCPEEQTQISKEIARLEAETDNILANQHGAALERTEVQKSPLSKSEGVQPLFQRLTFFTRAARLKTQPQHFNFGSIKDRFWGSRDSTPDQDTVKFKGAEYCGLGVENESKESSKSTVNVQCLSTIFELTVSRDTLPKDIAWAAANRLPNLSMPDICVVLESYNVQGLKRPLRQYERIQNVIDTWADTQKNTLIVLPHTSIYDLADLRISSVSSLESPPTGFSFQLHHSSQPGNWNKYWVTLSETGQVFATNQPSPQPIVEHTIRLCHLSECDVYTTSEQMREHFQLPAKFCFAIKRQTSTKSDIEDGSLVHMFSTDIEQLAVRFYELIQRWRSWYIAHNKSGYELRSSSTLRAPSQDSGLPKLPKALHPQSANRNGSEPRFVSSSVIAKWSPLLDMGQFDKSIDQFGFGFESPIQSEPTMTSRSSTSSSSSPRVAGEAVNTVSTDTTKSLVVPRLSKPGPLVATGLKRSSQCTSSDTADKGQPSSPVSLPEINVTPSWLPSAIEHSTRIRENSRRRSHRHLGASGTRISVRPRLSESYVSAPQQLGTARLMRPRPGPRAAYVTFNPIPRPPPGGFVPIPATRGRRFYKRPAGGVAQGSYRSSQALLPPKHGK